ncbi:hypothetical protein Tco_0052520 [Tanacetum coccineum]
MLRAVARKAIEKRFGGNEATKKTQRNLLKQPIVKTTLMDDHYNNLKTPAVLMKQDNELKELLLASTQSKVKWLTTAIREWHLLGSVESSKKSRQQEEKAQEGVIACEKLNFRIQKLFDVM